MAKSKTQAFSRPPWERMMRFHHLIKEKSYPNCNQVAKEFEVSWRTIMRDVDFMKCRQGVIKGSVRSIDTNSAISKKSSWHCPLNSRPEFLR